MFTLRPLIQKTKHLLMVALLVFAQLAFATVPFVQPKNVEAAQVCVNDTAGANDEPGQKDLTRLCVDEAGLPNSVAVVWNWDELGTSGANSLDACALFDSDNDGNINYAACVTTKNNPAVIDTLTLYSCGDAKIDRCTTPNPAITGPYTSTCTVNQQATQPFGAGTGTPTDTVATCTVALDDFNININDLELTDVCSYPSQQPNSDPSDCVIIQDRSGKLEVRKNLIPSNNAGLFNLQIDGATKIANVGDGGTTGEVVVSEGNHSVGETAGSNTSLASYSSVIECRGLNGTGSVIASGNGATLANVPIADGADVVCIITNTAAGSITIIKDAVPNALQDFAYTATGTGVAGFSLDDDNGVAGADNTLANTKVFNNLTAGTYTFTEAAVNGWDLASINCGGAAGVTVNGAQVTINLTAGQNVTCTYRNEKRGQIIVTKQTNPDGDTTQFSITASGTGNITAPATRSISDNQSVTYDVGFGTYAVSEQVPNGWTETSNNCSNLVINGNTPLVSGVPTRTCTIVNTKLAVLRFIKDSLPNDEQDFAFTDVNLPGSGFSLDDDADLTLSNEKVYNDLAPGVTYSVTEQSLAGWQLTDLDCDLGNFNVNGSTVNVTPTAGQTITCTFQNTKLGSISGTKFAVSSGAVDGTGGSVLAGWTIFIDLNGNGVQDLGEPSDVTDVNGAYSFSDLLPGNYALAEVLLAGWTQIFGPDPVNLAAGQSSTGNDFGNFQNASIGGFKWNDLNGNGQFDNEPKLSGWTITLYHDGNDADNDLDDVVTSTVTDGGGNYSFTNLAPDTYAICETQQANWVQTFPANNQCHTVIVNESGETNPNTNFGNQGRGNIQVVKNVDTDGDGQVDLTNVTDWTYDIDGNGNFATGSTQNVAAGAHTVSEDQKTNYHVTASSCSGETAPAQPTTSLPVTVSPGETVVCTFVNTRDTATITVRKLLNPTNDNGLFDLNIDGVTKGDDVSHGGGTGTIVVPTGTHNVSETAGTGTSMSNYSSSFECNNNLSGPGTTTGDFSVTTGQDVVCVFTNVRFGHIIVEKQTLPDGSSQSFGFSASYDLNGFSLSDGQSDNSGNLLPGNYSVSENVPAGWDMTSQCSDNSNPGNISLSAGETVTCVFTNTQRGSISGTKYEVNAGATSGTSGNELAGWTIFIDANDNGELDPGEATDTTDSSGAYSFGDLVPGNYIVCEVLQSGWTQIFPDGKPGCHNVNLAPGQSSTGNDFGNFQNGSISGYKFNDLNGNGQHDDGEPKLPNWQIVLKQGSDTVDDTLTDGSGNYSFTNLAPGIYTVCETQQAGWAQTTIPACYEIEINESGEAATAVFGNQGRGSITVRKNIDVNGDGDLDDPEDVIGATDWTWDLDGQYYDDTNIATGGGRSDIPADTYNVHEDQKQDYHFVSVACNDGETQLEVNQSETVSVVVQPGSNVVCTFTNARDTGFIVIQKEIEPSTDEGVFDLNLNGVTQLADASDGDATNPIRVVTGNHVVSETGGTETGLDDYESSYVCTDNQEIGITSGLGTSIPSVAVSIGQTVTCVFTNNRRPSITIVKDAMVDEQTDTDDQDFNFTFGQEPFSLDDDGDDTNELSSFQTFEQLNSGQDYTATELSAINWDLVDIHCFDSNDIIILDREVFTDDIVPLDSVDEEVSGSSVTVKPEAGQRIVCVFTNQKRPVVLNLTKSNNRPAPTTVGDVVTYSLQVSVPEDSGTSFNTVVTDLPPENFEVIPDSETAATTNPGHNVVADIGAGPAYASPGNWTIGTLTPGEVVTLTYQATIQNNVTPGEYPDIAFARGFDDEVEGAEVLSNLTVAATPFVGTDVEVIEPVVVQGQVLGVSTLVNTGNSLLALQFIVPIIVIITVVSLDSRQKKGANR